MASALQLVTPCIQFTWLLVYNADSRASLPPHLPEILAVDTRPFACWILSLAVLSEEPGETLVETWMAKRDLPVAAVPLARLPGAFVLFPGGMSTCPVSARGTPAKDLVFFPGGLMAEALSYLEHLAHFLSSPFPGALR